MHRSTRAITFLALLAVTVLADSHGCWTCAPGWTHWYDLGWTQPSNGDKCQCVKSSSSSDCWTCAPGYSHWYALGMSQPSNGDKCQCVLVKDSPATTTTKSPATTTKTPSTTRNCWTCASGWVHWYDVAGMAEPSDPCACVLASSTTTTKSSSTTTTKAATPTTTRNCWTCSAGYMHWYDLGMDEPADPCACVAVDTTVKPVTTTTTKSPTTTRNCWTCASGWTHWYDIEGMAEPSDPCACVQTSSTTTTKASTTTTTKAATPTTTRNCWTCASGWVHWYEIEGMAEPSDPCACVQSSSGTTTTTASPQGSSAPTSAPTTAIAKLLAAMTPSTTSTGSVSFSPGIGSYSPSNPPPLSLVGTLMDNLISKTKYRTIMTYYVDSYTTQLANEKGLKMLGIIYIVPGQDNSALINTAITAAKAYPSTILGLVCGNEMGANYGLTSAVVSAVSQCTSMLRNAGLPQPIGVIDTFYSWCSQDEAGCNKAWTAVSQYVDFIGLNDYMFWDNLYSGVNPCNTPTDSPAKQLANHKKIQALYNKPTILTEFGWPGSPSGQSLYIGANYITGQQCSSANDANQKTFIQGMIDLYRQNGMPCNTFEAYREPWKGTSDSDVNRYWGVCMGTGSYDCTNAPQ